jgi:hypothetical protein
MKFILFLSAAVIFTVDIGVVLPSMQALIVKSVPANRRGAANSTLFYILCSGN